MQMKLCKVTGQVLIPWKEQTTWMKFQLKIKSKKKLVIFF